MIRKLFQDYIFTGKNTHLKDMKRENIPLGIGEIFLYPLYFQIMLITRAILGYKVEVIKETILLLGFFFIWMSQIKHPMKLDRMYYLCPLDADERGAYLKNSFVFRGCLHSIVIMIVCFILYVFCKVNIFAILYILIDGILYSFLSNVRDRVKDFVRAVFVKPAMFLSAYVQFALPSAEFGKGDYFFIVCSFIFLLMVELPLFLWIIKAVRNDIATFASCEEDLYKC